MAKNTGKSIMPLNSLQKDNGELTLTPEDTIKVLADNYYPQEKRNNNRRHTKINSNNNDPEIIKTIF